MLSLHKGPLQANPMCKQILLVPRAVGAAATDLSVCSAGWNPAPAMFIVPALPEQVLPSPTGNTSVLWVTLTTPVT